MKLIPLKRVDLKAHPQLNEAWLQDQIAEDPSILGLGELELKDRERRQQSGGRLDLLLQNEEQRFEVELQLGATDETHIIRTIEYWDVERKRYPQYDHVAVIVAEEITSRFFNVISLFNGAIPIIAMQVAGYEQPDGISLVFTKILEQRNFGLIEEIEEDSSEATDRSYWLAKVGESSMDTADVLLELLQPYGDNPRYYFTKRYLGIILDGQRSRLFTIRPRKSFINIELTTPALTEWTERFNEEPYFRDYQHRKGRYRFKFESTETIRQASVFQEFLKAILQVS